MVRGFDNVPAILVVMGKQFYFRTTSIFHAYSIHFTFPMASHYYLYYMCHALPNPRNKITLVLLNNVMCIFSHENHVETDQQQWLLKKSADQIE